MQTLNVGAGQSENEYQASEQQRRDDLRSDSKTDASYFFLAAGLAAIGTGLLPIRVTFLCSIGAIDFLRVYGKSLGTSLSFVAIGLASMWVLGLVVFGVAGLSGRRWAFLAGIILYGLDLLFLLAMFSMLSFGVHAFFIFKWFQGQKNLKELRETSSLSFVS